MGVPTLTLAGETAPGRLGAAMLHAAGLGAFVAADREDFVRRGLYWGRNLDQLAGLRKGMRAQLHDSALGRPAAMAAGFAATLRRLWREWCANGI
jgi:predicted O-linked N-acetylglucosamine transferase (SPINDLY family)